MADEEEKKEEAKPAADAGGGKSGKDAANKAISNLIIVIIVVTVVISLLTFLGFAYVATFLALGLLPAITANIVDRRPGRYASKTITAFNIAGILPHSFAMASGGNPDNIAQGLISNPTIWLWVYIFAAFGWITVRIIPQIFSLFLSIRADYVSRKLRFFQKKLADEWGDEVRR